MNIPKYEGVTPSAGWIKLMRSNEIEQLMEHHPNAFLLATAIAMRARWNPNVFDVHKLEIGEALLGDHDRYGMTRKEYRTAINILRKHEFAAFRRANRGTIGKLLDTRLFDVSPTLRGHMEGHQGAIKGPHRGHIGATNEERNKEKKDKTSLSGFAIRNSKTIDLMERCRQVLGAREMDNPTTHRRWLNRADEDPDKLERVIEDTRSKNVDSVLDNPGAWAEKAWSDFAGKVKANGDVGKRNQQANPIRAT